MKRKLLPLSIFSIGICLFSLTMISLGVYAIIISTRYIAGGNIMALLGIVAGLYMLCSFFFYMIDLLHNVIILSEEKIIVTGHLFVKKGGLQHPVEINYKDIISVSMICANANSLKRKIKNAGYSNLRPFFYYEIMLNNGETKWIYIECFSIKQRKNRAR